MTITLPRNLSDVITASAMQRGVTPEALAVDTLATRFGTIVPEPVERLTAEELLQQLKAVAVDAGVSLSDEAVSSEGIYD